MKYSGFRVIREALTGHRGWGPAWRDPEPKDQYDIIVVGGGGHGLATAHYLSSVYRELSVVVLEKSWIGSGNVGRNTTLVRSNYMLAENTKFYGMSLKLWENLEQDLNYNAMVSQRGILALHHDDGGRDAQLRLANTMRMAGGDGEMLDVDQIRKLYPGLDFNNPLFPITGGFIHRRGGTARHDAVTWGYARAADRRGVDIIQNCEVTGFRIENGKCIGVETTRGFIGGKKTGVAVAGRSSQLMAKAGLRLPIESHVLQAFVTEGLKPLLPGVVTYGAGHFYISQSDKGGLVFGGDLDAYNSYAQRGNIAVLDSVLEGGLSLLPIMSRARLLRSWGGIMDMSMDGSPIIDKTHIDGLYFNGGWCYGGFKATPASGMCFAHLLSTDQPHENAAGFRLDRFRRGYVIDENGVGPTPNLH
ncbi:sarcosine oxidase subunit beta family protein [Shimia sediminis]|uniref:sarcosine oxidase subunit beta family protein n=1 Tax=Shimia sediminis TaxID=2497945 RepID=UPI000F8CEC30|nr:sarcosine oxidase subunit beta family protein [Shimia sediminis]